MCAHCSNHPHQAYHSIAVFVETSLANFSERRLGEVQGMRFMKSSRASRRTIAPFRALPFMFVATDSRRRVCQLYASAGESGLVRVRPECAKIAYLCGLSDPLGRVWTTVFSLVAGAGQRFESARRLFVFLRFAGKKQREPKVPDKRSESLYCNPLPPGTPFL